MKSQPSDVPAKANINDRSADDISTELKCIVADFNKAFHQWSEKSGCVANLGWNYRDGKAIEVIDIQFQLFKKPLNKPVDEVTMDRSI